MESEAGLFKLHDLAESLKSHKAKDHSGLLKLSKCEQKHRALQHAVIAIWPTVRKQEQCAWSNPVMVHICTEIINLDHSVSCHQQSAVVHSTISGGK